MKKELEPSVEQGHYDCCSNPTFLKKYLKHALLIKHCLTGRKMWINKFKVVREG